MSVDDSCKLFVAGLPDSISETVLRQLFEAAGGTVVEVSLPRDRATGRPRGFAFVTLSSEQQARQARDALDGSVQAGRAVSVRPFQAARRVEGGGRPESTVGAEERTLYLGNLPYDATVAEVEDLFARLGLSGVVRVNLPQDAQRRPRGFGFVTLSSVETAQAAVNALQNAELKGRRVSASIAHGKGERPNRPPIRGPGAPPMREERIYDAPEPDREAAPVAERETFDEPRRGDWNRKKKEPAPKKKKKTRGATERTRSRREHEGFSSPRARDRFDKDD